MVASCGKTTPPRQSTAAPGPQSLRGQPRLAAAHDYRASRPLLSQGRQAARGALPKSVARRVCDLHLPRAPTEHAREAERVGAEADAKPGMMLSSMLSRQLRQTHLCRCIKGFAQFRLVCTNRRPGLEAQGSPYSAPAGQGLYPYPSAADSPAATAESARAILPGMRRWGRERGRGKRTRTCVL
jgi:hypothetical protein